MGAARRRRELAAQAGQHWPPQTWSTAERERRGGNGVAAALARPCVTATDLRQAVVQHPDAEERGRFAYASHLRRRFRIVGKRTG